MIPTTELVWLSGGEPTLVPEGHELIQNLIDTGRAKDIKLRYVINLTNITDKFIAQFQKFKSVDFHCSIDGIEEVNHYMRYPSDFKILEQNLEKLTNTNANLICLIHTVSNLNIYRVPDVIDWIEKFNMGKHNKVRLNINLVNKPELFHISLLDRSTKELVSHRLLSYKTNQKNTAELKSLCDIMNEEKHNKNKLQKDFYKYITEIDKLRNQDILEYLPELENFLKECKNG
jgi:glutamate-1-semialdehyde 2,1-aminomutase